MRSVRHRYHHWIFRLPMLRNYRAICLGRTIYFKEGKGALTERLIRHEMKHQEQIERDGLVKFYGTYLWDYAKNLARLRNHSRAYREIPYEVEARASEES